jgi:hypothetical protein
MQTGSGVAHIILDFDGTCTQIPPIFEAYLDLYCKGLNESALSVTPSEWREAQAIVRHQGHCRAVRPSKARLWPVGRTIGDA